MAERTNTLMDQKVVGVSGYLSVYLNLSSIDLSAYLSIFLSIYLSIYLSVVYLSFYLSIHLSTYLSVCLSIHLSAYLSIYLSVCLSICLSVCVSVSLSLCISLHLSVYLSICPSVHLSICPSVHLSICLSIYSSVYPPIGLSISLTTRLTQGFMWQHPSRHSGVHFFDISTCKSGPNGVCFSTTVCASKCASRHNSVHFFHHLSSQKCSGHGVLLAFWLQNMLRATTSSNELPQAFWTRNASHLDFQMRRGAMHFLNISTSKSAPKLKCF